MALCGGLGDLQDATPEVQGIIDQVRPELEQKSGLTFPTFKAVKFRTQVVAGVNYVVVKVKTDENNYVHIKIWKNLQQSLTLTDFDLNKTAEDELIL